MMIVTVMEVVVVTAMISNPVSLTIVIVTFITTKYCEQLCRDENNSGVDSKYYSYHDDNDSVHDNIDDNDNDSDSDIDNYESSSW